jgi:hypothetical protein
MSDLFYTVNYKCDTLIICNFLEIWMEKSKRGQEKKKKKEREREREKRDKRKR